MALCEEFEEECCVSLAQTIERRVREAGEGRAAGNQAWWKILTFSSCFIRRTC
jgi:hypothetical protein